MKAAQYVSSLCLLIYRKRSANHSLKIISDSLLPYPGNRSKVCSVLCTDERVSETGQALDSCWLIPFTWVTLRLLR